ncbi:MAG: phospho-sugar mutase [Blastochloris sp.]|nr:phospho-sugar mutase [Blastochloris sp.]
MNTLVDALDVAVSSGSLLASSRDNIHFLLEKAGCQDWERRSVEELVAEGHWTELNDRFYKTLSFGTGGLRGRSMGRVITRVEKGSSGESIPPQHPAVGTNVMNEFNISRATQGLVNYLFRQFPGKKVSLVFSHDTRYFSRAFAELACRVTTELGADAYLFESERSTPELSFAVRHLGAQAGVMITASHNPPHDNGFKAYFEDGGQLVEPHATGVIQEVLKVVSGRVLQPASQPGTLHQIGSEVDEAYLAAVASLVLEPEVIRGQRGKFNIVFTPIHGTGIQSVPVLLERQGFQVSVVEVQRKADGGFPTVKSPNPENAEALQLGVEQARREGAHLVMGTDPDADRMGAVVRAADGSYEIITGNQIGTILAAYRLERFFAQGILNEGNAHRATLIKTFVTTDLQKEIAKSYGVKCVDTLTGFKYIGEKLKDYEKAAGGRGTESPELWRGTLLEKSCFFVFGGEESYGYSGGDYVRDKDANAAVLMLAEAGAYLASQGRTLLDYLDALYLKFGFYSEKLGTLTFEGAEGAAKIKKLLESYRSATPQSWGGFAVEKVLNFAEDELRDVDGKLIPKELMLMFQLSEGFRVAVRGSGTEPKIKFYFFGRAGVASAAELAGVKAALKQRLEQLWTETQDDVNKRVA